MAAGVQLTSCHALLQLPAVYWASDCTAAAFVDRLEEIIPKVLPIILFFYSVNYSHNNTFYYSSKFTKERYFRTELGHST